MAPAKRKCIDFDSLYKKKLLTSNTKKSSRTKKNNLPAVQKIRDKAKENGINNKELLKLIETDCKILEPNGHQNSSPKPIKLLEPNRRRKRSPTPIRADDYSYELTSLGVESNYNDPINLETSNNNFQDNWCDSPECISVSQKTSTPPWEKNALGNGAAAAITYEPMIMSTLQNIGNTCFINAALYSLRFLPTLMPNLHRVCSNMQHVLEKRNSGDIVKSDNLIKKQRLVIELHTIFSAMTARETKRDTESIEPTQFQSDVAKVFKQFVPGTQQDSHEFLSCLMDSIRDCSTEFIGLIEQNPSEFAKIINESGALMSFKYFHDSFTGIQKKVQRCSSCETSNTSEQAIIDLPVPLASIKKFSQYFIQDYYLKTQKLDGTEKAFCDQCQGKFESKQMPSYPKLPQILIVQLGRFDNEMRKITAETPIPFKLDCFCEECIEYGREYGGGSPHQYILVSAIIHAGLTLKSGHYYAYVRSTVNGSESQLQRENEETCCQVNIKGAKADEWFVCDDDRIKPITETEVKEKIKGDSRYRTPYILFYVREDLITTQ